MQEGKKRRGKSHKTIRGFVYSPVLWTDGRLIVGNEELGIQRLVNKVKQ